MIMSQKDTRSPRRASHRALLAAVAISGLWSCTDATDVTLLEIAGTGVLFGQAYLDLDASGTFTPADEPIAGGTVVLTSTSAQIVQMAPTDSLGGFQILSVPVGTYRLGLDQTVLGDSLEAVGASTPIVVALGDTTAFELGATFPILPLGAVSTAAVGSKVFTSGIALNSRLNFGDGQVHLSGAGSFLRGLNVNRAGVSVGDSVRFLGRVVADNGRPALDNVTAQVLIPGAVLVLPSEVTTAAAGSASGGTMDGALVRIRNAELADTSTTTAGHFRFWADDGSDSVEVWIRDFLAIDSRTFPPDSVVRISQMTGLLTPYDDGTGTVRWRLMPRGGGDISLETKTADVAVSMSIDTLQASLGDMVRITVVATNNGPLTATGLQLQDTIPAALTVLSSTPTRGTYDSGTGLWDIGSLAAAAADTLVFQAEVTDDTPPFVDLVVQSLGLTREVDPNGGNNRVVVRLTIS